MLVLSRRPNEKIVFPATHTSVQVVSIKPGVVRLGIDAPPDVQVLREEIHDRVAQWRAPEGQDSSPGVQSKFRELNHLLRNRFHVARLGLAVVRRQLQAGQTEDAEATLTKIEEDFELLQKRLKGEVENASLPQPARKAAKSRKALIVEDNANERELLAIFLRTAGLDVDTASDGTDALDYLHSQGRPDVVLLDMGLPRCDGPTTVREIRRDPACAGLKIFAVTGHAREEFDLHSGPAGVDRWFYKPVDPSALVVGLNQELGSGLTPM